MNMSGKRLLEPIAEVDILYLDRRNPNVPNLHPLFETRRLHHLTLEMHQPLSRFYFIEGN